jgi:hypothetical protein
VLRSEHSTAERVDRGARRAGTFGDLLPVGVQKVGHRPQRDGGIMP